MLYFSVLRNFGAAGNNNMDNKRTGTLYCANDIERNPGPGSGGGGGGSGNNSSGLDRKCDKLERLVTEVQREVKNLKKSVDSVSSQMDAQTVRERPKMASLIEEINVIKETMSVQTSQSKRLKSDLATLEYDLTALKKVGAQQRNDLKQIGNLIMTELKTLRETTIQHENRLTAEGKISSKFTTDLPVMVTSIRVVGSGLADLKKEIASMKGGSASQLQIVESAMKTLHTDTGDMCSQLSRLETSHHGLRESFDEQMYALNETLDAQTHMVHSHSEGISDLKETSGKLWNKIDEDISSHNERLTHLEDALTGKNADSNEKFDQLQCLINHHGESVSQLSNQVQQLTGEFRGVLQTVDDQVNASQLRLETMVAMASDKAVQLQEEIANRSHADRQHVNGELRNQAEKIVNAMQKLSLRMDELDGMYDDMQERLYEVDKSRKNNLVFYGIPQNGPDEDPDTTERLLKSVVTNKLQVRREMIFTKVVRLWNGPSFRGLKPILVTFHLFKDKEDILRKSPLLRGSNIYITEDYSRKVRKHREELLKFAKLVKSRQAGVRCLLQYDRLYVDNDVYLYNEVEQRVQRVLMKLPEGGERETSSAGTQHVKKLQRDLGLPAEEFEANQSNCCVHCSQKGYPRPKSRPPSMADEDFVEFEATIIQPMQQQQQQQQRNGGGVHVHPLPRMSTLEVVEEENTPGTTPSPSNYLPDIHHNQNQGP